MPEYKNFAKLRQTIKAPMVPFALSDERVSAPEYKDARAMQEHPLDYIDHEVEGAVNDFSDAHGLPKPSDELAAGITWAEMQSMGNMAGSLGAPVVKAATAAKGIGQVAKEAPSAFGRIVQVAKEEAPQAIDAAKKFGKIIFK